MVKLPRIFSRRRAFKQRVVLFVALVLGLWVSFSIWFPSPPTRPEWANRAVTSRQRAEAVKDVFKFAWKGYYQNAFPNDELIPLWNSHSNSRNGWGATAVESLGTAAIMDIPEIVDQIMEYIPTIDFNTTETPVDLFETTIRYIGGMLSAYDLLSGPLRHLAQKPKAIESLLAQSKTIAERLKFAFNTKSGIPRKILLIDEQISTGSDINTASSIGTLVLEWTRLSDLTGDKEYAVLVEKAMKHLLIPQPKSNEPFPGITGTWLNVDSGFFTDAWGSWGAGGDSFYEYLIKMFAYDQSRFGFNKYRWIKAADSVIGTLAESPPGTNLTFINSSTGKKLDHETSHLECFAGGNFIFAGKLLNDTRYIDFGLKVTESCHEMYARTATGIGPEKIRWSPASMSPEQEKEVGTLGFAITDASYQLRPETMESYYYAYRVTKDRKYQDWAWDAFVTIVMHTKTRNGFAPISNVNEIGGGWRKLRQESYFFSEFLKYAFLIFAEEAEYQFNCEGPNEWVFNTEGHPLKINGSSFLH